MDRHLPRIIALYQPAAGQAMLDAMQRFFARWRLAGSKPDGGMFVWAKGPVGNGHGKRQPQGDRPATPLLFPERSSLPVQETAARPFA